jgi:transcriptional regulator with XRE-family HTH domain
MPSITTSPSIASSDSFSEEAGLSSKGYLSRIESGERLPSLGLLTRLARRLGVEIRDFFIVPERGAVDRADDSHRDLSAGDGIEVWSSSSSPLAPCRTRPSPQ